MIYNATRYTILLVLTVLLMLSYAVPIAHADEPPTYYAWIFDSAEIHAMHNGEDISLPGSGFGIRTEYRNIGAVPDWSFGHVWIIGFACHQTLCAVGIFSYHANPEPQVLQGNPGTLTFSTPYRFEEYDSSYITAFGQSAMAFQAGIDSFIEEPTVVRPMITAIFALVIAVQLFRGVISIIGMIPGMDNDVTSELATDGVNGKETPVATEDGDTTEEGIE